MRFLPEFNLERRSYPGPDIIEDKVEFGARIPKSSVDGRFAK